MRLAGDIIPEMVLIPKTILTTRDTLVAIAWRWRLQCARAEVSSCAALIHSPCELGGCLVHDAQHQPLNPGLHLNYEPFSGIQNFPNKLRWNLVNFMVQLGWLSINWCCRFLCQHLFHTAPEKFRLHGMYRFSTSTARLEASAMECNWGFRAWSVTCEQLKGTGFEVLREWSHHHWSFFNDVLCRLLFGYLGRP